MIFNFLFIIDLDNRNLLIDDDDYGVYYFEVEEVFDGRELWI